jgi:hypothetical protein
VVGWRRMFCDNGSIEIDSEEAGMTAVLAAE